MEVIFLDIVHFKQVNDSLGHGFGDSLLVEFASRLKHSIRDSDTFAGLGGDEFVILLEDIRLGATIEKVIKKVTDSLQKPFSIDGHQIYVTISLGVAIYPSDGADATT